MVMVVNQGVLWAHMYVLIIGNRRALIRSWIIGDGRLVGFAFQVHIKHVVL